jgi:3-phosphoshikimate 1-carboxyvinyltransferase
MPDPLEIRPLERPPRALVTVPGSKSITNRALALAALASRHGDSTLANALRSEDTEYMVNGLRHLGFCIECEWDLSTIRVCQLPPGAAHAIPAEKADIFVGNSGTCMRFLTSLVALGHGQFRLDGGPRMRQRPIEDMLQALKQLGVDAVSERANGCPPVVVTANGLVGGQALVRANVSSQFLSGLLIAAPLAQNATTLHVDGSLVSRPYVDMTRRLMQDFGAVVEEIQDGYRIGPKQRYAPCMISIEPDASAASYFFGAAAITGGEVTVRHLSRASIQGDTAFVRILESMGCRVRENSNGLTVRGDRLRGISIDMRDMSDCAMTLTAVSCFADGPTTIRGITHIRHKETDRIAAMARELTRIGAKVEVLADGLRVIPDILRGAEIQTYNDHRIAMSMALVGLMVPGIRLQNPACVAKTYPAFFQDLAGLYHGG